MENTEVTGSPWNARGCTQGTTCGLATERWRGGTCGGAGAQGAPTAVDYVSQEWVTDMVPLLPWQVTSVPPGNQQKIPASVMIPMLKYTSNWHRLLQLHEACSLRAPGSWRYSILLAEPGSCVGDRLQLLPLQMRERKRSRAQRTPQGQVSDVKAATNLLLPHRGT